MSADTLRIAGPDDFQELFRICCLLHKENGQFSFSELKVREIIWRSVNRDGGLVAVIGSPSDIKAMILLTIEEVYYSQDQEIVERWNFVRPDCRKTDYAKQMIRFAKRCAAETGLVTSLGIISDERLAAKRRLYERELSLAGYWFTIRPKRAEEAAAA
jgi:hypothetical protein